MLGKLLKYEIKATGRIFSAYLSGPDPAGGYQPYFYCFSIFPPKPGPLSLISGFVSLLYILLICGMFAPHLCGDDPAVLQKPAGG